MSDEHERRDLNSGLCQEEICDIILELEFARHERKPTLALHLE